MSQYIEELLYKVMTSQDSQLDEKTLRVLKKKGYKIDSQLRVGAFGQVYKASKIGTDELAAVKVMDLKKVSDRFKTKFLPREVTALVEVSHESIVKTYDIFKSNQRIFIFMEFVAGGDLADYLKEHKQLNEPETWQLFAQVADAMTYLHNVQFMAHRDIKVDNILLSEDHKTPKLTDFGFAKEAWDQTCNRVILSETYCGTEPYFSPELVRRVRYDPFKGDVWALGVVLFAMLNNKFPFHFGNRRAMLREMMNPNHLAGRYTKNFSKHLKDLQNRMFDTNESNRINMNDVHRHEWVREEGKCRH